MRRKRKSIWTRSAPALFFAAVIGTAAALGITAAFAAFTFFLMDSMQFGSFFSAAASITGAVTGSFICGRYRRNNGLAEGVVCGFIMYIIFSITGLMMGTGFQSIKSLLRLTISGAVGGVAGVNSKRPKKLRD